MGCGGVENGEDVFEHLLCGATAVQIGTSIKRYGVSHFDDIKKSLVSIMKGKKYYKLEQFRGNLKTMNALDADNV